ncbi:iron chelate uptake ABC transporter family permease subunit [Actinotalea sp. K2]|uniref:FecCD family ABC transporter permease n=1 Tax=Actinotalea sp. K2 TaxID=2939438 RepID=UPI002017A215|nr:iron chelate uptake ABC transporter family permease subunit [Actinotalea sp. K2]MCL3861163.1 iron chelate uptake ABC transporter family permease subunit [Actinotalea sp. K2]
MTAVLTTTSVVVAGRARRGARRRRVLVVLAVVALALLAASLLAGTTYHPPADVLRALAGENIPGASFAVRELRLPRAVTGLAVGLAFGVAGTVFQTMLRNPLAAPDVIGISSGASAAAVFGIVVLSLGDTAVALLALGGGLTTATLIYLLAVRQGFAGTRLILIGIGMAAMLDSTVTYVLSRASQWDLQAAMQWLAGSLNGASWSRTLPLLLALAVGLPLIAGQARNLQQLRLGDDAAAGVGVPVDLTRLVLIATAVTLLSVATAAAGPIAFVAFMAGPIAARLIGQGDSPVLAAGMVGAILVLAADLVGQLATGTRYPVGVVTGVLGAPYLLYLLVRTYRTGGAL